MRGALTLTILVLAWLAPAPAQAATPAFSVHKNGTAQTIVGDTPTKLTWSTEVIDTNANFASDRFTPTIAGNYLIVASVQCAQPGACIPAIYKNGLLYAASRLTNQTFADQSPQVTAIVSMNGSTDYVEAFATSSGTSIVGAATQTYFSGSQVDGGAGSSSQWIDAAGGVIYYSGGNVGIGTNTPLSQFTVRRAPNTGTIEFRLGANEVSARDLIIRKDTTTPYETQFVASAHPTSDAGALRFFTSDRPEGERMVIHGNGNVGIGTTTPVSLLDISKTWGADTSLRVLNANGTASARALIRVGYSDSAGLDIFRIGNAADIYLNATQGSGKVRFQDAGVDTLTVAETGNVGIGTTMPDFTLDVVGTVASRGTASQLRFLETDGADPADAWHLSMNGGTLGFIFADASGGPAYTNSLHLAVTGNVGIGTTAPSHILHITGQGRSTVASWATSSDARVKEDIDTISDGLVAIDKLRPVTFRYTDEYQNGDPALAGLRRGFVAQEVEAVLPDAVTRAVEKVGSREISDFRVLGNSDFVPLLVSAVKELKAANDNQGAQIEELRREVEALKGSR